MNNLPLQPLVWKDLDEDPMLAPVSISESPLHHYVVLKDGEGIKVRYSKKGADFDYATGFATIDEAKAWAWNHYNEKMQPYVKPSPVKVYELAFDCDDSYFTVFMTTDKQAALDFMQSVKDADQDFISSYGFDDDADELLIEQYDDNHPLKPYASKIFEPRYEDSFSEWAISYAGNSLVSQMSIIEHELFSTMQNLQKGE